MLEAKDLRTAMSWSKRRLGTASTRAELLEVDSGLVDSEVEKSGTGIGKSDCIIFMSIKVDSAQKVSGTLDHEPIYDAWLRTNATKGIEVLPN